MNKNQLKLMDRNSVAIDSVLIGNCINGHRISQKLLYNILSPRMFPVCLKFFNSKADAEDVLQEGFIKLFNNLYKFRGDGSFEGWVRKIFVNTAIEFYRRQKPVAVSIENIEDVVVCPQGTALDKLFEKDVLAHTYRLSDGYRTVFHLYAIEGYSHKEIAGILNITESTSKSQYSRAKATIRHTMSLHRV